MKVHQLVGINFMYKPAILINDTVLLQHVMRMLRISMTDRLTLTWILMKLQPKNENSSKPDVGGKIDTEADSPVSTIRILVTYLFLFKYL